MDIILCTGNDPTFKLYEDKVNDRKVYFSIKQIFKD